MVAYLFWQRRDGEPAFLVTQPDEPDLAPAQTPPVAPSASPSAGPVAPDAARGPSVDEPPGEPASPADPVPTREFVSAPRAIFGLGDRDEHEERPGVPAGHGALDLRPRSGATAVQPAPVMAASVSLVGAIDSPERAR